MNTIDSLYCNFIAIDYNLFQCDRCGLIISSEDEYAPIMICHTTSGPAKEPSLSTKIVNLAQSVIDHAANGFELCDDNEISKRFSVCNSCEFFQNNKCKVCGCPILSRKSVFGKLSWKSSKCPLNKW